MRFFFLVSSSPKLNKREKKSSQFTLPFKFKKIENSCCYSTLQSQEQRKPILTTIKSGQIRVGIVLSHMTRGNPSPSPPGRKWSSAGSDPTLSQLEKWISAYINPSLCLSPGGNGGPPARLGFRRGRTSLCVNDRRFDRSTICRRHRGHTA